MESQYKAATLPSAPLRLSAVDNLNAFSMLRFLHFYFVHFYLWRCCCAEWWHFAFTLRCDYTTASAECEMRKSETEVTLSSIPFHRATISNCKHNHGDEHKTIIISFDDALIQLRHQIRMIIAIPAETHV